MREKLDKLLNDLAVVKDICRRIEGDIRSIKLPRGNKRLYEKVVFVPNPAHIKVLNEVILLVEDITPSYLRDATGLDRWTVAKTMQFMGYKSKVTSKDKRTIRIYKKC